MTFPGVFFIFFFIHIFIFWAARRVKGQIVAKDDKKKKSVCCIWYLSNHISYDCHLWYTCVNNISRSFFHLFKILIFWIVSRVKGQKIAQNYKKNSVMICSAWYIKNHTSWLPSLVHKCKIILSPGIFLFFQNFGFLGC